MKYFKMFGLILVAAAALSASAGTASAAIFTSPANTVYTSTIKAELEGTTSLHLPASGVTITCQKSTLETKVERHGKDITAGGNISGLTISDCGTNNSVAVKKNGALEYHTTTIGSATITWSGGEVTAELSFGFSCTFTTSNTDIGTITGGTPATIDVSYKVPRTGDSFLCGTTGEWTGSYKVVSPSTLLVD